MELWPGPRRTPVSLLLTLLSCLGRPAVPPPLLLSCPPPHLNPSRRYLHRYPMSLPEAWKQSSPSSGRVPHQLTSPLLQGPVLLQLDPSEHSLPSSAGTHQNPTFIPSPKGNTTVWPVGLLVPTSRLVELRPLCQDLVQLILHSADPIRETVGGDTKKVHARIRLDGSNLAHQVWSMINEREKKA